MLAPARIPVAAGKKMAKTEKNVSPWKSGPMFSHRSEPERSKEGWVWKDQTGIQDHDVVRMWPYHHNQRSQMPSWIRRKWRFQWSSWWWLWSGQSAGRFGPAQKEKSRVRTETPPRSKTGAAAVSYFGLPLHSCHRDAQEKDDCYGADDSDVVDIVRHDGICTLSETKGTTQQFTSAQPAEPVNCAKQKPGTSGEFFYRVLQRWEVSVDPDQIRVYLVHHSRVKPQNMTEAPQLTVRATSISDHRAGSGWRLV